MDIPEVENAAQTKSQEDATSGLPSIRSVLAKPIAVINTSKINFLPSLINAVVFALFSLFILGPILSTLPVIPFFGKFWFRLIGFFVCVSFLFAIIMPFLAYAIGQKMYIYPDSLRYSCGFFSKETKTLPLIRVTGVETRENFWQRVIGAGDIIVLSGGLPMVVFKGAKNPVETAAYLQKISETRRLSAGLIGEVYNNYY